MSRFTRKTVLALAAIASLGAFALTSNDASARGFGGGGMRMGGGHIGGMHVGGGIRTGGFGFRRIGGIGIHRPGIFRRPPIFVRHYPHHWRFGWGWRHRYWHPGVVAGGVATGVVASTPIVNRCNCLTKEYTPEGAVVFKDLCTNEAAMNPPVGDQSSAYDPTQQPSVQGNLQPQVQTR
jgi:hypothetical protein